MRPRRFVEPVRPVPQTRINENIRVARVRLIDEDGAQLGIKPTKEAMQYAFDKGLDLVEVASQSRIVAMSFCEPRSCRLQLSS